jgi:hypothetical protein
VSGSPSSTIAIPAGDTAALVTHLMTERALVDLFRGVIESVISEQLARVYTMRLAAENARRLADDLAAQCNLIRRSAITNSLLEIVARYDATMRHRPAADARPLGRPPPARPREPGFAPTALHLQASGTSAQASYNGPPLSGSRRPGSGPVEAIPLIVTPDTVLRG